MKTVFNNTQCAHIWAQQSQERGKSNNGNVFFEGKAIYSYGYHFPMGYFLTPEIVLLNGDSYSNSTSKQQGYTRQAVTHKTRLHVSTRVLKAFSSYHDDNGALFPLIVQNIVIEEAIQSFNRGMEKAAKRRVKRCKVEDTLTAIGFLERAQRFFLALETPVPEKLSNLITKYKDENSGAIETYLAELAAKEAKTKAENDAKYAEARAVWLAHGSFADSAVNSGDLRHGSVLLRLKDDKTIETSRGAEFPTEHGIKALKFIRHMKEHGAEYLRVDWEKNPQRLGSFTIDKIDARGNVTAGCHFVPWESIEHIARVLKIFP